MSARSFRGALAFILVSGLASAAFAADAPRGPIAQIGVTPSTIQWRVLVPSDSLTLTISTPDVETFVKETKGAALTLTLQELGALGVNGTYVYDLRVTPPISADIKDKLKQARKNNDTAGARRIMRQAGLDDPAVFSGAFSIAGGAFVSPDLKESSTGQAMMSSGQGQESAVEAPRTSASAGRLKPIANDQVIPDDLIVQGSECVGLDCVVNESFGFDTIRLKENNTRIKFQDTSTSAGFPTVDWQLTANDSASGGASKFSIDDIDNTKTPFTITAGAPTNSMFVASNGKVGLRTSTPVLDIHALTTDTPAMRFEQSNAGGFTAQTWDVAGNEANFFVRDVTGGSRLPFRIRPGAPTSSIDINALGNVGINTASPAHLLDVRRNGSNAPVGVHIANDGTAGNDDAYLQFETSGSRSAFTGIDRTSALYIVAGASGFAAGQDWLAVNLLNGNIGIGGSVTNPTSPIQHSSGAVLTAGGVWTNASSRDTKQDIKDLSTEEAMNTLQCLTPVKYAYKVDPSERHVGFIAEDVPDLVATKDRKNLSPMDIVAVLSKVVQDQQKTIDAMQARLDQLEHPKQ
jgi:endosialidase-like protein